MCHKSSEVWDEISFCLPSRNTIYSFIQTSVHWGTPVFSSYSLFCLNQANQQLAETSSGTSDKTSVIGFWHGLRELAACLAFLLLGSLNKRDKPRFWTETSKSTRFRNQMTAQPFGCSETFGNWLHFSVPISSPMNVGLIIVHALWNSKDAHVK